MIPTVEECIDFAAYLLAGNVQQGKKRFPAADLVNAVQLGYQEMISEMVKCQVPEVEATANYTLPASTTTLTPATAGIANMGEPIWVKQYIDGDWFRVPYAEELPTALHADRLSCYRWASGQFEFESVPVQVLLEIRYLASGKLADSGSIGIDDSLNVIARLAAAIAGPPKGVVAQSRQYRDEVYREPGFMQMLIQPMLRTRQRQPVQWQAYRTRGSAGRAGSRAPV